MRALIIGNLTFDVARIRGATWTSPGGPPSYAGPYLREAGVSVDILSCFGNDMSSHLNKVIPDINVINGNPSCSQTTSFSIEVTGERQMALLKRGCKIIERAADYYDAIIINPVIQEVRKDDIRYYRSHTPLLYLDPQGFLRKSVGDKIRLVHDERFLEYLRYVDYMKADPEEIKAISGSKTYKEGIRLLLNSGLKGLLVTDGARMTSLFTSNGDHLRLSLPKTNVNDGIGMGDLMGAGFVLGLLRPDQVFKMIFEGDSDVPGNKGRVNSDVAKRAGLVLGVAAAISAADKNGLNKIPDFELSLARARELYTLIKILKEKSKQNKIKN